MPNEKPKRYRGARNTAKTGTIEKRIEAVFKLPKGSVQIRNKDGGNTKSTKKIEKVRQDYL
jgi:hypothetical protein